MNTGNIMHAFWATIIIQIKKINKYNDHYTFIKGYSINNLTSFSFCFIFFKIVNKPIVYLFNSCQITMQLFWPYENRKRLTAGKQTRLRHRPIRYAYLFFKIYNLHFHVVNFFILSLFTEIYFFKVLKNISL